MEMNITLTITANNGEYIVSDPLSLVYGDGKSALLALADYAKCLAEYAELVERHKEANPEIYKKRKRDILAVKPTASQFRGLCYEELSHAGGWYIQDKSRIKVIEQIIDEIKEKYPSSLFFVSQDQDSPGDVDLRVDTLGHDYQEVTALLGELIEKYNLHWLWMYVDFIGEKQECFSNVPVWLE